MQPPESITCKDLLRAEDVVGHMHAHNKQAMRIIKHLLSIKYTQLKVIYIQIIMTKYMISY